MMQSFKYFNNSVETERSQWFLIQYDGSDQKLIRKIVKCNDLIMNDAASGEATPQQPNNVKKVSHAFLRRDNKFHLVQILSKTQNRQELLSQLTFIQMICMQLSGTILQVALKAIILTLLAECGLNGKHFNHKTVKRLHSSPSEISVVVEQMQYNRLGQWLLIMYSSTLHEEEIIFGVFNKNAVILKKDSHSHNIFGYVHEEYNSGIYKGLVVRVSNDFNELMFLLNIIRNEIFKMFQTNTLDQHKRNQEIFCEINAMERHMYLESNLLLQSFQAVDKSKNRLQQRLIYLQKLLLQNQIQIDLNE